MDPFTIRIPDEAIEEVARRLAATRWIDDPSAGEPGYGATLALTRRLVEHWRTRFDWRTVEARINAEANVIATIDGLKVHAVHRRSTRPDATALLLIHGWPSSLLEFLHLCDALAEPPAGEPAFHVVIPSLPGYGFSTTRPGTSPRRITALFAQLMADLGHARYLVQGGNWGSAIGTQLAREVPEHVIGLHLNSVNGSPPQPGNGTKLTASDQAIASAYATLLGAPHFNLLAQGPLSPAHALNDSPAGLAAWIGEKLHDWSDLTLANNPALSPEWMVATAALYWFTSTAASSGMLYREAVRDPAPERFVRVPTAVAHFAHELVMIPRPWAERHYNIVRWTTPAQGGHYPAVEVPELFLADLRAFAALLCGSGKAR